MLTLNVVAELQFDLKELVGTGGQGEVRRAVDLQMDAILAVKVIPVANFPHPDLYFDEAKKLYLSRHHNVVPIQYACRRSDTIYLAMPYYRSGSIAKLVKARYLTCAEVIRYSLQFLSGLNNLHSKGLLHFDVKLDNILLSDSDVALLADFGLAKHAEKYGFAKVAQATEMYAPPEYFIHKGGDHDVRYDIYQAGVAMYIMCRRFDGFTRHVQNVARNTSGTIENDRYINAVKSGKFRKELTFPAHIPPSLRKIIQKSIRPNPDDRYTSTMQMLNALSSIRDSNQWEFIENSDDDLKWSDGFKTVHAQRNASKWDVTTFKKQRRHNDLIVAGLDDDSFAEHLDVCLYEEWS